MEKRYSQNFCFLAKLLDLLPCIAYNGDVPMAIASASPKNTLRKGADTDGYSDI